MQGRHRIKKQVSSNPKLRDSGILKIFFWWHLLLLEDMGRKSLGPKYRKMEQFLYLSGQKTYN